jgi:hypothetical protein
MRPKPASAHFKLRMMPYPLEPEPLYLIERRLRQHLGALTNPEHGTMSRVRSDGHVRVLRH